ncbi:RNA methyltransferase, partial [candidate division KSB1 bacterium]|nr:RNA methyltransferase [candidate division KSB1 bacterium]
MQLSNKHLKELRRLHDKKYRRQTRLFLIEGLRLCEEALLANAAIQEIIVSEDQLATPRAQTLLENLRRREISLHYTNAEQITSIATTESPAGLVAVLRQSPPPSVHTILEKEYLMMALDDISDPGNLGTILRTACWFGVKNVFLNPACVEIYNPKVVRGSMGAIFYMNLFEDTDLSKILSSFRERGFRIIATSPEQGVPLSALDGHDKNMIIIGNEAHGINELLLDQIDVGIHIPRLGSG